MAKHNTLHKWLDLAELDRICGASIQGLMKELTKDGGHIGGKRGARYAYKNNGAKVLAVAHLDTVQQGHKTATVQLAGETLIFNPRLDDRLGAYTILRLLPKLGIEVDILLTENEEKGASTAQAFDTKKQYNWIVEFDRAGDDAVIYDYTWGDIIKGYFKKGLGSFSDITCLEHLGCQAVNIGVGYQDCHSPRAYFVLEQYVAQIRRFIKFHGDHKDTHHGYDPDFL